MGFLEEHARAYKSYEPFDTNVDVESLPVLHTAQEVVDAVEDAGKAGGATRKAVLDAVHRLYRPDAAVLKSSSTSGALRLLWLEDSVQRIVEAYPEPLPLSRKKPVLVVTPTALRKDYLSRVGNSPITLVPASVMNQLKLVPAYRRVAGTRGSTTVFYTVDEVKKKVRKSSECYLMESWDKAIDHTEELVQGCSEAVKKAVGAWRDEQKKHPADEKKHKKQ